MYLFRYKYYYLPGVLFKALLVREIESQLQQAETEGNFRCTATKQWRLTGGVGVTITPTHSHPGEKEGFQPLPFLPRGTVVLLKTLPPAVVMADKSASPLVHTSVQRQEEGSLRAVGERMGEPSPSKHGKVLLPEDRREWAGNDKCLF